MNVPYVRLGVNVDHVATVRQARRGREPDPVAAAVAAELGGADQITVHLREDRRHVQERDLRILRETVRTRLNLELALADEVLDICVAVHPDQATLVPERRQEVTTEGGLDVRGKQDECRRAVERLRAAGIHASAFVDPDEAQVEASHAAGFEAVELHTGAYAHVWAASGGSWAAVEKERERLVRAGAAAVALGIGFYAGHGIDYVNVQRIRDLAGLSEVNIGHAIVARALFVGLEAAVRQMKDLLR